jgi:predicted amidohydrolase YtcJ
LIVVDGHIVTEDDADRTVEALAIRAGRILAVGSDAAVRALAGRGTRLIDLHGRTATPGLIDTHAHLAEGGIDALKSIDLSAATSIADIRRAVAARAATLKPGAWLTGAGWDEGKLAERRYLRAADLDAVAPHNPVWLEHTTGHYGAANGAALALAGIDASTQDPSAGTIDRDADGRPSGVLKESAQGLVTRLIPADSPQDWRRAILAELEVLHREGMTGVKDPDLPEIAWDAYASLARRGLLGAHVCVLWHSEPKLESAKQLAARVARLPLPPANDAGLHVATHAIGDRAIDWVVDTYAAVLAANPKQGLRHAIIHANTPTDHALQVMVDLQGRYDAGYPETQAEFLWWIGDNYAGNLGPARAGRLDPYATYVERGIRFGGGSDYPVTPLPARLGLWSSVTRTTLRGTYGWQPFGTAESIGPADALRSYTRWAAHELFLDAEAGSLEVGKSADLAAWDHDPLTGPVDALEDLKCELTLFRGKVVFRAKDSPITDKEIS